MPNGYCANRRQAVYDQGEFILLRDFTSSLHSPFTPLFETCSSIVHFWSNISSLLVNAVFTLNQIINNIIYF